MPLEEFIISVYCLIDDLCSSIVIEYFDIEHCNCRDMWHLTMSHGTQSTCLHSRVFFQYSGRKGACTI